MTTFRKRHCSTALFTLGLYKLQLALDALQRLLHSQCSILKVHIFPAKAQRFGDRARQLMPASDPDGGLRQESLAPTGFHIEQIQLVATVLAHDRAKEKAVAI